MLTLLYLGPTIFSIEYNLIWARKRNNDGAPTWKLQHYTLLFQTLILMNIANMFNCRVLSSVRFRELNIFANIFGNYWFFIVVLVELNLQYLMTSLPFFCDIFGCTPITSTMHLFAVGAGVGSLLVGFITKLTPFSWTDCYARHDLENKPKFVDEILD